jgi:hypothetical protein
MRTFILLITLTALVSCNKLIDRHNNNNGQQNNLCTINSMLFTTVYDNGYTESFLRTFYNNKWGDPDSLIYDHPGTGHANWYFTYDKNGRLIKHDNYDIGTYNYVYEQGSKMPVRDTLHDFYTNVWVHNYTYDNKGRIIKIFTEWLGSDFPEISYPDKEDVYTYNADGNLDNSYFYHDDKINYLRTSKILQFIYRDYSLNNMSVAQTYNNYGLPTLFFTDNIFPPTIISESTEITYNCKK